MNPLPPSPAGPQAAPEQPLCFRAGRHLFRFPGPTVVMGIVNVTPDSFSDGGLYLRPEAAVQHGLDLARAGAGVIDVGGESTRPGAVPVSEAEELRRVIPVIERLVACLDLPVSIDTQKPAVARAALAAGATLVNDIAASRSDPELWAAVAAARAGYVCMHMQGRPDTMQQHPSYDAVVPEIQAFFSSKLRELASAGLSAEQVLLDVGIGFGKTLEHNLQLLGALGTFKKLGRPLLLGVSRKSFIGKLLGVDVADRLPGSIACACWASLAGVQFVRVHDVAETVQALRMLDAIRAHAT